MVNIVHPSRIQNIQLAAQPSDGNVNGKHSTNSSEGSGPYYWNAFHYDNPLKE
ncbi:hypothetical protein PPTG_21030 [Phytophthora nicotianae INRA-310]|uniref:Uncharacterized protein n=1 Tax=Phytophthora nicotianae (strain INRA-310) TaxID=761204 RepID=W2R8R6_PHYN3|nr:hypothetical protein PPTG_21030 [Phytophthora nicotianae INRA-310]ETN20915.1 hypothetical protein PPTG_21030 [Phytophthora nicotianae INRA-310]